MTPSDLAAVNEIWESHLRTLAKRKEKVAGGTGEGGDGVGG